MFRLVSENGEMPSVTDANGAELGGISKVTVVATCAGVTATIELADVDLLVDLSPQATQLPPDYIEEANAKLARLGYRIVRLDPDAAQTGG